MSNKTRPLILSVDDDQDILTLMQMVFKQTNYDWIGFKHSAIAYKELQSGIVSPDLIILDMDMPEMNGIELCQKLQKLPQFELVPILFLTAHRAAERRLIAFQSGAVGYLQKPINPEQLIENIRKYIDLRKEWESAFIAPLDQQATISPSPKQSGLTIQSGFHGFIRSLTKKTSMIPPEEIKPDFLYDYASYFKLTRTEMAELFAQFLGFTFISEIKEEELSLDLLPIAFCRNSQIIPLKDAHGIIFATPFPFASQLQELLDRFPNARRMIAPPSVVDDVLSNQRSLKNKRKLSALKDHELNLHPEKHNQQTHSTPNFDHLMNEVLDRSNFLDPQEIEAPDSSEVTPLVRLVNQIISEAFRMRASDIHIEPWEEEIVIRYRIDGELKEITRLQPLAFLQVLASRLKIMANIDSAERRLPQDGRIVFKQFNQQGLDFDLRMATAPMNYGEKIVMRILDKQKSTLPLAELGLSERNLVLYRQHIRSPYGMVLHVGPTGSGKSMTLYSALNEINRPEVNIQTAEDPIEYTLPGVHQLQVKPTIGLTFARALRAYLRQDPDIILVGEIRDRETAEIALEAALTGHLLLSTLHTNDAASTLVRFMEMGLEPYLLASSIVMICAQRLMRRLCPHCKIQQPVSAAQKSLLHLPEDYLLSLYHAVGCEHCHQIGYQGRIGVHELLVPGERLRQALNTGANTEAIKQIAVEEGMTTLFWDGFEKVLAGLSSLEELLSRVKPDASDCRPKWWFGIFDSNTNRE